MAVSPMSTFPVALFLVVSLIGACDMELQAYRSGTALRFNGESYATATMRFDVSFHSVSGSAAMTGSEALRQCSC